MNRTDVQGTLRDMWDTRPARPHDDRKVAGVASAIARRYDIDPVLVRVGFVVAAFSGIGAALYILGWIVLPAGHADPGKRSAPHGVLAVGLGIAALGTLSAMMGLFSAGGEKTDLLLPAIVVAVLMFLLHRSRGGRRPVGAGSTGEAGTGEAGSGPGPSTDPAATTSLTKDPAAPVPPAWDPLGVAPFAWDLPEPAPAPPAPPPRRLPVTPVTLGTALLAGAVTTVVLLLDDALALSNLPILLGVLLAVVGSGLVIGSFVRAGRGLIPIAILLGALTWGALSAPLHQWQGRGFGDLTDTPTTATLQPVYQHNAGEIDLDLRNLDLTATPTGTATPLRTRIELGLGDVRVLVPAEADLNLTASLGIGDARFGDQARSGPDSELKIVNDLGDDGIASGRPLDIDIEVGAGDVEVHRG